MSIRRAPVDRTSASASGSVQSIAVIGPLADTVALDWYSGTQPYTVTPLAGSGAGRQKPLYAFGYGLSYTTFAYSGLGVDVVAGTEKRLAVSFDVKNTGARTGD